MINKVWSWNIPERLDYNKLYMVVHNNEIFKHDSNTRFMSVIYERLIFRVCSEIRSDLEFIKHQ